MKLIEAKKRQLQKKESADKNISEKDEKEGEGDRLAIDNKKHSTTEQRPSIEQIDLNKKKTIEESLKQSNEKENNSKNANNIFHKYDPTLDDFNLDANDMDENENENENEGFESDDNKKQSNLSPNLKLKDTPTNDVDKSKELVMVSVD
eukprot:CAMPEP_0116970752 /NCGR_PEP_ID=MMETSP0467-20121206/52758_1 /TAXON_ID=283647 /ORGANISM="Mesodinium pulex, Strain SPMC105" /LENGTH=148 /DNA_ID=CAMNT_0004661761 /DNA_START=1498 /DNA_END=1944 /DNA_ORIENTATION=+